MISPATVAFQGGGALGMAHLGAWQVLAGRFRLVAVAGTSAGSIVAALSAAGHTPAHAIDLFYALDWPEYVKPKGILGWLRRPDAWSRTQRFHEWLQRQLSVYLPGAPQRVTFASLYERTGIYLAIVATDLNDERARPVVFDKDVEPDTEVAFAVRASIALPGVFETVERRDRRQVLVDGGVLLNFPVESLQPIAQQYKCPLIGVRFTRPLAFLEEPNIKQVLQRSLDRALARGSLPPDAIMQDPTYIDIEIDASGFNSMNFNLTGVQKQELVRRGAVAAERALDRYDLRVARSSQPEVPAAANTTGLTLQPESPVPPSSNKLSRQQPQQAAGETRVVTQPGGLNEPAGAASPRPRSRLSDLQRKVLEDRRERLSAAYQAANEQFDRTLSDADRERIKLHISQLKQELEEVERELNEL